MKQILFLIVILTFTACDFIPRVAKIRGKAEFLGQKIMKSGSVLVDTDVEGSAPIPVEPTAPIYNPEPVLDTTNECSNAVTKQTGTNIVQSVDGVIAQLIKEDGSILKSFGLEDEAIRKQIRMDLINEKKLKLDMTGIEPGQNVSLKLCDFNKGLECLVKENPTEETEESSIETTLKDNYPSLWHQTKMTNLAKRGGESLLVTEELKLELNGSGYKDKLLVLMDINAGTRDTSSEAYQGLISTTEQKCVTNEVGEVICKEVPVENPVDSAPIDSAPSAPSAPECDYNHSPLIIDVNGDGVSLASPMNGVIFDIVGDGNKLLISWPNKSDDMLLVLPKHGKINSIDELFGNNTLGPDFKKAANGFEALAKYDINKDGFIDKKDPIFVKLRLWRDSNMDGISAPGEFKQLSLFGITAIDLDYVNMYELDKFHNETKQRSVAVKKVGEEESLLMIFDVWFRGVSPSALGF